MTDGQLFDGLSPATKGSLALLNRSKPIFGPSLVARISGFSREGAMTEAASAPAADIAGMKAEVYTALDNLEKRVDAVLAERKSDETEAKRWILFIGIFWFC
ncbi:hypothetical protein NLY33_00185 [Mesorhizobium sp. C432A]|uniref:hypothetical protein n=1 Tax=Mesorhizobium sp. C432A TaxID=2956836 RepID=UPI002575DBDF|nr:hypothetical protein [Mesorhizobium sp. C432A]WJI57225.1 hypothetical protein NLY33_00185 [Mesorhizobium sp. C432A]